MIFDPLDPYRDLRLTENHDCSAVMMGITGRCALAEDGLSFDDKAGRDMLYPVLAPEPGHGVQLLAVLASLGALRRRARGTRSPSSDPPKS